MKKSGKLSLKNNMFLFGIGVFFTKIMNFIFAPIYSHFLSTGDFGSIDILTTTAYLIIPISTLAIAEAILKFGIADNSDLKKVFSTGVSILSIGLIVIASFTLVAGQFIYKEYLLPVILYFLFECIFIFLQSFARAQKNTISYVVSSIIYCSVSIGAIMVFLLRTELGVSGYFYGLSIGVFTSILFLLISTNVFKYFSFREIDCVLLKKMLFYSAPLVLSNIGYWIISGSDKYITRLLMGDHMSGLLAMVHKIPNLCTILFSIFNFAYVMSALKDHTLSKETYVEDNKFYSELFEKILVVLIFGSLLVILLAYPITLLYKQDYLAAWIFVPLYSFGVILGAMRNFYASIYCTQEKTVKIMIIVVCGALINILSCYLFMKFAGLGLWSTAISTILANGFIFVFYYFDSKKYISLKIRIKYLIGLVLCLLLSITPAFISNLLIYYVISSIITVALVFVYRKQIKDIVLKLIPKIKKR